jgi:DnaA family protein
MEQLVFELAVAEPPRLENFLPGRNAELVNALRRFAAGQQDETGMFIWGAPGAGKSHLLHAARDFAQERGVSARLFAHPSEINDAHIRAAEQLIVVDRVDEADAAAAGRIFTLYNALKENGARLLAASRTPLATLQLREDLRTRLGWGLVYEIVALPDEEKSSALAAYAQKRGFGLSSEVVEYLLRHRRRDMGSLLTALAALDRVSLATKRPITVRLVKELLQSDPDGQPYDGKAVE